MQARVYDGYVPAALTPFGAIVSETDGEVLYVTEVLSVLAPAQLKTDCLYNFSYTINPATKFKSIRLVPPTVEVQCGLDQQISR